MTDSLEKRTNDFIEKLKDIGYTYVSGYKNYKTTCNIKCPEGHIMTIMPRHLWEGQRCSTCRKLKEKDEKFKRFLKYIKENAEGYTYVSGFVNYKTKCTVRCPLGHEYKVIPSNFTWGKRCAKCAGNKRIEEPEFKQWCKDNLTDLEYVGGYTKIASPCTFKCLKCGKTITTLSPNGIKNGRGCYYCGIKKRQLKQTYPLSYLTNWLKENNPNIEYVSGYINSRIPCRFRCLTCGTTWNTAPGNFYRYSGCPNCAVHSKQTKGEKYIENYIKNKSISYTYPKIFSTLRDKQLLHYDFYIPSYNLLIEYQGQQHYAPVDYFGGIEKFAKQNLHDDMKRDYAKSHGYNLLEMPYTANTQEKVDDYLADYLARLEEKVGGI